MLQKVYEKTAVKNKAVFKWFGSIRKGNESEEDDESSCMIDV